ncbi:vitelline membrane outer layer protein 1 homolog [Rhinoderma darwinii]|uniref:vitelline membrane outer layer protein 1 homolog n=1 Tax=Rhinoderma darwinii TaxID=43563 RepID=UPI003F66A43F
MWSSVLVSLLIQAASTYGNLILVNNGGNWGDWGILQRCPPSTSARGFSLKVEAPLGSKRDDTALNGIKLYCTHESSTYVVDTITSSEGDWGDWTTVSWCPTGNFISFTLKVEKPQGDGDDTAANNLMMQCSDYRAIKGNGGTWGNYGGWSGVCPNGICGIKTKVEERQGRGDDTALNDVQFECC